MCKTISGSLNGEVPILPHLRPSFASGPAPDSLFPGQPGAPPRKTYFDLMEGFFDKPEINIFGPGGPPPPPPSAPRQPGEEYIF